MLCLQDDGAGSEGRRNHPAHRDRTKIDQLNNGFRVARMARAERLTNPTKGTWLALWQG
jgi:hypothetical protein